MEPHIDPHGLPPVSLSAPGLAALGIQVPEDRTDEAFKSNELEGTVLDVLHATRSWIQLCTFGFAVACIVIGAVEALLGK